VIRLRRGLPLTLSVLAVLLSACGPTEQPDDNALPFVFRSLNLRQQEPGGRPAWELTSPEARYDMTRRVARALSPRGVIYADGKPAYRLEASSGTVLNDGEVILLEGRIRVEKLGPDPVLITASRVRWTPRQDLMEIDRHPQAMDAHNRLQARKARFRTDRNRLVLRGDPQLERWSKAIDPFEPRKRTDPEVVMRARSAVWRPDNGDLEAEGPVRGTRNPAGAAADRPPQTLTANSLKGNTERQRYLLEGDVKVLDPAEKAKLQSRNVLFDMAAEVIRTDQPFRGNRGDLLARGTGLRIELDRNTVVIEKSCALDRPGEQLRADRCSWNWENQDVEARGSVTLKREEQDQFSRGQLLRGRLGKNGRLEMSNPGGRVLSRFRVPRGSPAPRLEKPRRAPPPIRL
jgi:LPS export ABC transporter protein LptC